jgi:hypothetical protein
MADFILFQDHHVIERQALKDSPLLQKLTQMNLFNIEDAGNHLNMPAVVWHLTVRMRPFRQLMALNLRFAGSIFGA